MAKPFPKELKEEVLAIALKREVPVTQLAKDFGVSASVIHGWVKSAEGKIGARKTQQNFVKLASAFARWNKRTKYCDALLHISVGMFSQNEIPAGP